MAITEGPMKRSIKGKIRPKRHSFMVWEMLRGTVEPGGMSMLDLCPLTHGAAADLARFEGLYVIVVGFYSSVTDRFFVESVEPQPMLQPGEKIEIASRSLPNVADIADRIMEAIERDQAIHRDTLIRVIAEELGRVGPRKQEPESVQWHSGLTSDTMTPFRPENA